jgi:hypothetical protein
MTSPFVALIWINPASNLRLPSVLLPLGPALDL